MDNKTNTFSFFFFLKQKTAYDIKAQSTADTWQASFTRSLTSVTTNKNLSGQIAALSIESVRVGGDLENAQILVGANLGSDGELGGTGTAADAFGKGTLERLKVKGDVIDSQVRVGVDPTDGLFDNGDDTIVAGSSIQQVAVRGQLLGNTLIESAIYPHTIRVDGRRVDPLTLPQVRSTPTDTVAPTLGLGL